MREINNDIFARAVLLYAGIFIFGIAVVVKASVIYVKEGKELVAKAQQQEIREFVLESARGNILSSKSDLLATSIPIFDIRMDVANENISDQLFRSKVDSLALCFSKLFPTKSKRYYKNLLVKARKRKRRYQLLKRKVTYDELQKIRTFPILRRGKNRGGLILVQRNYRQKPFGELAARTIGFVNEKEHLFVGLEGYYNNVLKGIDGVQLRRRINHGDWIPIHDDTERQPVNGKDIKSTIDVDIQDVAQEALLKKLQYHEAKMGTVVVMDVTTGHILAMVNLNFDPKDGKYKENYNFAVGKRYEPGSVFKLASIMAALEHKKVNLNDSLIFKGNTIRFGRRSLSDAHPLNHGRFTIREAFEHSSNIGISKIIHDAYKSNPAKYVDFLYSMGLNKKTGIDIKGEPAPLIKHPVKNKNQWWGTTLPWMSIGYEVMLTPLQILTFYNAVANNGVKVKPALVKEIKKDGKTIEKFDIKVLNPKIASQHTIDTAKSLLEGVVLRGTGKGLKNDNYKIAGKTGTAQIMEGGKFSSGRKRYNATFVGYFPAGNPKYSMIVVVNDPKVHGYYGAVAAAPVFKEVADYIYSTSISINENFIPDTLKPKAPSVSRPVWYPDMDNVISMLGLKTTQYPDESPWVVARGQDSTVVFKPKKIALAWMPNVRGMTAEDAVYLLENMGMHVTVNGRGKVVKQSVKPGSRIRKGSLVTLNLGRW